MKLPISSERRILQAEWSPKRRFEVALTFDDGYLEHYSNAKTLKKLHARGTFFVITGLSEWEGKPLLAPNPSLVREIAEMGNEVGSHTVTHPNLASISVEARQGELRHSKEWVQDTTGRGAPGLAYPYGASDDDTMSTAKGYYDYGRGSSEGEFSDSGRYNIAIRHLSKRIAKEAFLARIKRSDGRWVILIHNMSNKSLAAWVLYFKLIGCSLVTLNEMVNGTKAIRNGGKKPGQDSP